MRYRRSSSFDLNFDDTPPLRPADWTPRPRVPPPRRLRSYVVITAGILAILYLLNILRKWTRVPPGSSPYIRYEAVDWSHFAYSQYVTDSAFLCNAIMVFEALHRLGSRAERILFYPHDWDTDVASAADRDSQLLVLARDHYNVQLFPMKPESIRPDADPASWDWSITKLLSFSATFYDRIIHIDSDVTILQNMDELFFLPSARVAMPRAYWENPRSGKLTSLLVVLEPNYKEYQALMDKALPAVNGQVETNSTPGHEMYDMELLNERYGGSALVLPHRQYGLLTGEFRNKDHRNFLGNEWEEWDPDRILKEAKLVHFSDWPLPKPWVLWPQALLAEMLPKCDVKPGTPQESGCRDREVWRGLYEDFRQRRKDICKLLSYRAPEWSSTENKESERPE